MDSPILTSSHEREPLISPTLASTESESSPPTSSPISSPSQPVDQTEKAKKDFATIALPYRFRILLGVSSAAMAVSSSSISLYCVNYMNFEPVQLTHYYMYLSWSALLNPIIGFLSDTVAIRGENRRPLVIFGTCLCFAILCLFAFVDPTTEYYTLFVFLSVLQQWAQSCISVPINGMMVEMVLPDDEDKAVATKLKEEGTLVIDSMDGVTTTTATVVPTLVIGENENVPPSLKQQLPPSSVLHSTHATNINGCPTTSEYSNSNASMNEVLSHLPKGSLTDGEVDASVAAQSSTRNTTSRTTSTLSDSSAKAKHLRITAMGNIQSQAMVYRSIGSLGGSIIYTVFVIWISLSDMLWISALFFAPIIPAVLALSAAWCESKEYRKRGEVGGNAAQISKQQAQDEEFRLMEKCLTCQRKFKNIWQRFTLGWDWRKPSEGTIGLLFVLLFVFFYSGTLDGSSVYFAYVSTQFEFAEWLNSFNMCLGMLGSVVGAYVYGWFTERRHKKVQQEHEEAERETAGQRAQDDESTHASNSSKNKKRRRFRGTTAFQIFTFGSICGSLGYLTNMMLATDLVPGKIPIPPYIFVPFDNFLTSLFSRFAFMPILTVAAERCPEGYEAAVYELFSTASLLGGSLSAFLTGRAAQGLHITSKDYSGLWILLVICAGTKMIPVLLAAILPVHEKSATATLAKAISNGVSAADSMGKERRKT